VKRKKKQNRSKGGLDRLATIQVQLTAVGLEANFDTPTQLAYRYRLKNVYTPLQQSGLTFPVLADCDDKGSRAIPMISKGNVDYVAGCGHGDAFTYKGYQYDLIFQTGYNPQVVQDKIIHLLSCRSGMALGPYLVSSGCLAFFGYTDDFFFVASDADIFFECDAQIDLGFGAGMTASEVYEKTRAVFNKYIDQFNANSQFCKAATLKFDRDALCSPVQDQKWGNRSAKLR
jgi:hypothetical protein